MCIGNVNKFSLYQILECIDEKFAFTQPLQMCMHLYKDLIYKQIKVSIQYFTCLSRTLC